MIRKQSSMPLIEVNENCSSNSINMMIGGMLSMISQVMKRDVMKDTPTRIDREIKLFLSYLNFFQHLCKQKTQCGLDHITISHC